MLNYWYSLNYVVGWIAFSCGLYFILFYIFRSILNQNNFQQVSDKSVYYEACHLADGLLFTNELHLIIFELYVKHHYMLKLTGG